MPLVSDRLWKKPDVAALAAGLLFCAVLALLPLPAREWLGGGVVGTFFAPLEGGLYQLRSLAVSRRENGELRRSLMEQRLENAALRQAGRENDNLRSLLGLRGRTAWTVRPVQVSGREPSLLAPQLIIDRGREDGIAAGMVALAPDGLVGRVAQTDRSTAAIQTVFDRDSRVSGLVLRSRVLGIFRCFDGMRCQLDRIPIRSDVAVGDTVISSGYGGVFPPGQMLGTVEEIIPDAKRLQLLVVINPSLNLNRVDQLFIVTGGASLTLPPLTAAVKPDSLQPRAGRRPAGPSRPTLFIRPPDPRMAVPDTATLQNERSQ